MQTAFLFFLLVSIAYVQCRPSEQPVEAVEETAVEETVEEKDFCKDIGEDDQVLYLGCISGMVDEADKIMKRNGGDVHSLLEKICGGNGGLLQMEVIKALEMSDQAIEYCSMLIQSPTM
uniref:Putative secreted protein n=1 Tax=Amblyomma americanum TaxID=6943 RepID=A0A0C9S411_AMBAM